MGYGKHNGRARTISNWPCWTGLAAPISLPFENWAFWNSLLPVDRRLDCMAGKEGGWFLFARCQYVYSLNRQVICNVIGMGRDSMLYCEARVDLGLTLPVRLSRAESLPVNRWREMARALYQRQLLRAQKGEWMWED